jgi:hypothetical protein
MAATRTSSAIPWNKEALLPLILQWDENFDIRTDTGTPVKATQCRRVLPAS